MKNYTELLGKYNVNNIFILGAGPSLYFNMQEPFFKELSKYGLIISVNSAILAGEPHFWISNDSLCMRWSWWKNVKKSKCIKIVRNSWLKYKDDIRDFYIFKPRNTPEDVIDFEEKNLCYPCSVSSAIDLSIQLKCKNIFVLGLDHKLTEDKHHFWQYFKNQPRQLKPAQAKWDVQKSVFPIHLKSYKALRGFAEYKNCKIYNCNSDSKVEIFEKIKFKDVEKIINGR